MTIHHDKLAYGRFAPLREDFSEERLEARIKQRRKTEHKNGGAPIGGAPPRVYPQIIFLSISLALAAECLFIGAPC